MLLTIENIWLAKLTTSKMKYCSTKYPREIFWTHEIPTRKICDSTKYQRIKISYPGNTREKIFWTHETQTRKYFEPTKYPREKVWDARNYLREKKWTHEYPWTHEISDAKNYPKKKIGYLRRYGWTIALAPQEQQWRMTPEI